MRVVNSQLNYSVYGGCFLRATLSKLIGRDRLHFGRSHGGEISLKPSVRYIAEPGLECA